MNTLLPAMIVGLMLGNAAAAQVKPVGEADAAWMRSCGVRQDDIAIVPQLSDVAEFKLNKALRSRQCGALKPFMATRDFVRLFTPPPVRAPMPPKGFDNDFMTEAESNRIDEIEQAILDKIMKE